ncbi:MAG: DUF1501 domain-containing protein [Verrucomicrobia bacterium]|nr:DUF1501 domain-containing protein [Verrucomicrobiota bacterium]
MNAKLETTPLTRRGFLVRAGAGASALGLGGIPAFGDGEKKTYPQGKAEHCIFIWLGGGAAHMDTWDPKRPGDPAKRVAGSAYPAMDTAIPGVQVCEHLKGCAKILDRFALLRTVNHDLIDEHAAATNFVHTGRKPTGTITYPSIGSIVAHQRGALADGIPPYVVIGYPMIMRGPGFLGAKHSYIYLTDTEKGPAGLTRPPYINSARAHDREELLAKLRRGFAERNAGDKAIADYNEAAGAAAALGNGEFMTSFELDKEPASLRAAFGGEFGQRCLLARRLIQRGARFIEVSFNLNFINGTGWDTHNDGQLNQHILIQQLDQALAALVLDLERTKLLDKTLVVVATEFGRPIEFDAGGGRGHQGKAFSIVLAGGGLRTGQAVGETDEMAKVPVKQPLSVPDVHATIACALGINPAKNLYDGSRPVPITDRGEPARQLFG